MWNKAQKQGLYLKFIGFGDSDSRGEDSPLNASQFAVINRFEPGHEKKEAED